MKFSRRLLGSKIHRATVTQANLEYEGSITLPPELMKAADILNFEQVHIWNVTKGTRLETYAIQGLPQSHDICINGAAAHLMQVDDVVIIASFIEISDKKAHKHQPKAIFLDENNQIKEIRPETPGPSEAPLKAND